MYILKNKYIFLALIIFPILFTLYTIQLPIIDAYDTSSFMGYAEFKLLGDRKPVWDASYKLIMNSLIITPAGNILEVYLDYRNSWDMWQSGAHNIFLEIGRQIGGLGMILLSLIMLIMLYRTANEVRSKQETVILYCFLSIFLIFGFTGNSLVYDGVGAFYWFLVGQFYWAIKIPEGPKTGSSIAQLSK